MTRPAAVAAAALALIAILAAFFLLSGGTGSVREPEGQTAAALPSDAPVDPPDGGAPTAPEVGVVPPRRAPGVRPAPAAGEPEAPAEAPVEPRADAATLRITSDVPGAQVFLDRQFLGAAPVTAENVALGSHQLNVSAEGFDGIARTIDVEPGARDIEVRFREVRLDARLPVVHRHRIGSCRGELVATATGIRYVTDNRDDGFEVPLSDLEAFEVDYLEKNLRVRLRRGRQLNFSDPEGNADRLFVFHRDVDKARTQLASGFAAGQ